MLSKQALRNQVVNTINSWSKAANYEGCPFGGYEEIKAHRTDHPKVLHAVLNCLEEKKYNLKNKSVIDIGSNIGYFPFALRMRGAGNLYMVERQGKIQKIISQIAEIEELEDVEIIGQQIESIKQAKLLPKCDIVIYKSVHHWIKKFIATELGAAKAEQVAKKIFQIITSKASLVIYEPCNFGKKLPTKKDNNLARESGFDVTIVISNGFKNRDVQVCLR